MRRTLPVLLAVLAALSAPAAAHAQSGLALKGHYLFNESNVEGTGRDVPSADGFSLGAELIVPLVGIGVGVSAYTTGTARDFDVETSSFGVLGEANYFVDIPLLPLTPYAGLHAGLGRYTVDELGDAEPEIEDGTTQLGWQVGVRWQINPLLGIDAQYRRVSESADEADDLERSQVLVGVTLF